MAMHNPPHPGEFIREVYLEPSGLSARHLATKLKVAPSTVARILQGRSAVSPEMALRLSRTLGRSAESWLAMQSTICGAPVTRSLSGVEPLRFEDNQGPA
jgi:antitoxin HigA-1